MCQVVLMSLLILYPVLNFWYSRVFAQKPANTHSGSPSIVISPLLNTLSLQLYSESARFYMRKGLATSTLKSYDFARKTFALFCVSLNLPLKPGKISAVCAFICHCMDESHFKPQYIRGLVAGIQFNARCFDPSFPSLFSNPAIKLLLKGISKVSPSSTDNRLPIILSILHKMLSVLIQGYISPHFDSLLDCSFLFAFYGFLRSGEFTTSSNSFDPVKDVTFADFQFCPFKSMCKYLKIRPGSEPNASLF